MMCKGALVRLSLNVHVFVDDYLDGDGASGGMDAPKGVGPVDLVKLCHGEKVVLKSGDNEDE